MGGTRVHHHRYDDALNGNGQNIQHDRGPRGCARSWVCVVYMWEWITPGSGAESFLGHQTINSSMAIFDKAARFFAFVFFCFSCIESLCWYILQFSVDPAVIDGPAGTDGVDNDDDDNDEDDEEDEEDDGTLMAVLTHFLLIHFALLGRHITFCLVVENSYALIFILSIRTQTCVCVL